MGSDQKELSGPDLGEGVAASALTNGKPLLGHAAGEAVMLVREGDRLSAVSATCSHYGGPLAEGLVVDGTVRCPWHHACFDLGSGDALGPGLSPISCFEVVHEGGLVKVGARRDPVRKKPVHSPNSIAIVGAGPAGAACAETLRRFGYTGAVTVVGNDEAGTPDRPNLSKDYLAGSAPEEWVTLRSPESFAEQNVQLLLGDPVASLDTGARQLRLNSGKALEYGALLIATGAEPVRLALEGAALPHVFTLRNVGDSRAIIERAVQAKRAVVLGSSFIGLEVAASLRKRGVEVAVVSPAHVPLERVLGEEVGRAVQTWHEENGVVFRLGKKPARITETEVVLDDGARVPAELVVMGVGVRPRTEFAERAGLRVDNGIVVDERLCSAPDIYAAGDVARYPYAGELVRIEHWAVAMRHGQAVAQFMMGSEHKFSAVPFFWSQHYDTTISYVGHAARFDRVDVRGKLGERDAFVAYRRGGRIAAVATIGRDGASLEAEHGFERQDDAALERLFAAN